MPEIELKLKSLECLKQSEKESDEIYLLVEEELFGQEEKTHRFPENDPQYWEMKAGETKETELTIYRGAIEGPSSFELDFREDDSAGLSSIPVFGKFLNKGIDEVQENEVGELKIFFDKDGNPTWKTGDDALEANGAEGNERIYHLRGAKAHYKALISATKVG